MCESEEIFYEDERRLKESGVRNVFTPHTPINQENLFPILMIRFCED